MIRNFYLRFSLYFLVRCLFFFFIQQPLCFVCSLPNFFQFLEVESLAQIMAFNQIKKCIPIPNPCTFHCIHRVLRSCRVTMCYFTPIFANAAADANAGSSNTQFWHFLDLKRILLFGTKLTSFGSFFQTRIFGLKKSYFFLNFVNG